MPFSTFLNIYLGTFMVEYDNTLNRYSDVNKEKYTKKVIFHKRNLLIKELDTTCLHIN